MPNVKFRASRRTLTSHAGLSIIGQCFEIAGVDSIDSRFPTTLGMRTSDVIKSYLGLLCLGMSDYDAVENFRRDKPFQQLLTLQKVPSAATLRQRLEKLAANDLQARTATWSTTLLSLIEAPITAETTHVCLDIDTFVMDNSNSKKEGVSRTYQKVDGYTPIAAYLGNEGWCLGLELRPGKQHTMKESNAFLERVLPRAQGLTKQPILLREDSGFDSQAHLALLEQQRQVFADEGRRLDYVVKWNPRGSATADQDTWLAVAADYWEELRPGKRQALWPQTVSIHDDNKTEYVVQRVMRLVERTADRDGQLLLEPDYELEGWWTSLDEAREAVINPAPRPAGLQHPAADGAAGHDRRAEPGAPSRQAAPDPHRATRAGASCGARGSKGAADHPRLRAGHRTHDGVEHPAKPPALSARHAMLIVCRTKAPRRGLTVTGSQHHRTRRVAMHEQTGHRRRPMPLWLAMAEMHSAVETESEVKKCSLTAIGKVSTPASRIQGNVWGYLGKIS